mmetsp:Transcript_4212/g.12480  ORF Transcript_4212/g.12480 Transcript_4212/m.12480 type:complete len:440 (+) Transcript_4212:670-1989(+)
MVGLAPNVLTPPARVVAGIAQHGRGMLGPAQRVELVVVGLTVVQEGLPCFTELILHHFVGILCWRTPPPRLSCFGRRRRRGRRSFSWCGRLPSSGTGVLYGHSVWRRLTGAGRRRCEVRDEEALLHWTENLGEMGHHRVALGREGVRRPRQAALGPPCRRWSQWSMFLLHRVNGVLDLPHPVIAFEVRDHGWVDIVPAKVLLVNVGDAADDAQLLGSIKHTLVPAAQSVLPRDLLIRWMAEDNVVVPLERRASPNVRGLESTLSHVTKVRGDDLVVGPGPQGLGLEEIDGVEVRDVYTVRVGRGAVSAILVNEHDENDDINAMDLLGHEYAFRPARKLLRVSGVEWAIALQKALAHYMFLLAVRDDSHGDLGHTIFWQAVHVRRYQSGVPSRWRVVVGQRSFSVGGRRGGGLVARFLQGTGAGHRCAARISVQRRCRTK